MDDILHEASALFGDAVKEAKDEANSYFDFPAQLIALDGVANDTKYDKLGDLLKDKKATLVVNVATY